MYQVKWYYKDTIRFSFSLDITNITIFARNSNRLNHGKSIYSMQLSDDFRSCLRYRVTAIKRRRMWVTGRNCDTRPSASVALNQLPAQLCVRWLQSWIHWVLQFRIHFILPRWLTRIRDWISLSLSLFEWNFFFVTLDDEEGIHHHHRLESLKKKIFWKFRESV